jgi:hypothetical protein
MAKKTEKKKEKEEKFELAVVDFDPPALNSELAAALAEEGIDINELKPDFIKMPSGGILSFVFPKRPDGKQDLRDEFDAVVLFAHECNAFWPSKDNNNTPPSCNSIDGKTGYGDTLDGKGICQRSCTSCPMNQYGTAIDTSGQQGKGKACKNMRRLYVMTEDETIAPKILSLPPSSLGAYTADWRAKNIVLAGLRSHATLINFQLEGKNISGKEVGIVKCALAGQVAPEVAPKLKAMQENIKTKYMNVAITGEDYNTEHPNNNEAPTQTGETYQGQDMREMEDSM